MIGPTGERLYPGMVGLCLRIVLCVRARACVSVCVFANRFVSFISVLCFFSGIHLQGLDFEQLYLHDCPSAGARFTDSDQIT